MIFIACIIAITYAAMMGQEEFVLSGDIIKMVNEDPELHWTAGVNDVFDGKKLKDVRHLLGWLGSLEEIPTTSIERAENIPDEWDTYKAFPKCKHPIMNQGQCGSCWAFSACEAMSDRFCIAGEDVILSPQWLVSCESDEYACQGGYLSREWEFMEKTGVVSEKCFPYASGGGSVPACPKKCKDGSEPKYYKVKSFTHFKTVEDAQTDMMKHGSVQAAFSVYQDFFSYKSGVYSHKYGSLAGGHAIKIQGWGVDSASGKNYWNVANSWGAEWGMEGYFWIVRGTDECSIEDQLYGGIPNLD